MKAIIYGFGQMGQKIYKKLKEENHTIIAVVSNEFSFIIEEQMCASLNEVKEQAEIIIDFSHPNNLDDIIAYTNGKGSDIKVLLATTGYSEEQLNKIEALSKTHVVFQSYNMSFGISLIIKLLKECVNEFYENHFDIELLEKHHNKKIDAPSGTAKLLYQVIEEEINDNVHLVTDRSNMKNKRERNEISIQALRGGTIFGEHSILFAGVDEIVEINHTALSRDVFVIGAIHAAKILLEKKEVGYYTLKNIY